MTMMQGGSPPPLTTPEIVDRMLQADNDRHAALVGYSGVRRYRFENKKSGKSAEMTVRMSCGNDGIKTFEVVEESGSGFVRNHIIRKMIDAEAESSHRQTLRRYSREIAIFPRTGLRPVAEFELCTSGAYSVQSTSKPDG
ncbi:MAG: hypothetical protein ABI972_25515 [Acidobacteriota bacterium]